MSDLEPGDVSFLEIGSGDATASRKFFGAVFGWPQHDEAWLQATSLRVGSHEDPAPQINVFFKVPDLEVAADRVRAAGGQADVSAEAPGFGRFANCRDPGGVRFGLHEP